MPANPLNLADFPDSAHAHELQCGVGRLRFEAPLEEAYTAVHLKRVRLRVRVWFSVNLALTLLMALDLLRRSSSAASVLPIAHVGALLSCTATLCWLVWSRHYERMFLPIAQVLVPTVGILVAAFIALAFNAGQYEYLAALAVNVMAVFFFTGLMFRRALLASAIMVLTFAVIALGVHLSRVMLFKSMAILTLTGSIAAIVYWDIEQLYRRTFLEGSLIGELIVRDGLSGLMNRRAFDEHLLRVWHHAQRDQRSIAVVMIDIDHFKRYNDTFGHQAGDMVLRSVARIIQNFARRPLDLAARYGGEEFAVILYDLPLPHVEDTAERLRNCVQDLRFRLHESNAATESQVTVSIGVGLISPIVGRTPQGAIQLADEALYEAKQAGRNCVEIKGMEAYILLNTGAFTFTPREHSRLQASSPVLDMGSDDNPVHNNTRGAEGKAR